MRNKISSKAIKIAARGSKIIWVGTSKSTPTPPQPDYEHKHDKAMLCGVPDQMLEKNIHQRPKNVLAAKKKERASERIKQRSEIAK